jgi:hypothetical protein
MSLIGDILPVYSMASFLGLKCVDEGVVVSHCLHGGKPSDDMLELLHALARAKVRTDRVKVVLVTEVGGAVDWWRFCCNCVEMWAGTGVLFDAVCPKCVGLKWQRTGRGVGVSPALIEAVSAHGLGVIESDKEGRCVSKGYNVAQKGVAEKRGISAFAKAKLPKGLHDSVDNAMLPRQATLPKNTPIEAYDIRFLLKHGMLV